MALSRRDLLAGAAVAGDQCLAANVAPAQPIGVAAASYGTRIGLDRAPDGLGDPLAFLRFCRERGAGGVQTAIPVRDDAYYRRVRAYLDETGTYLEGSVRLPRNEADTDRFEADVRAAKAAGATVLRTVMLSGRRYEAFATADDYRRFKETSSGSVLLAAPLVARHGMRLAVENHKDYRADELAGLMRRVGSPHVGVCVDTGNNLTLLEEPLATVETLSPSALSCHLKDMGVAECPEGFLLSEVPFGRGFLDLKAIVARLRRARPEIRFFVEMITRDPLLVPCLGEKYWATLEGVPGVALARTLALVRRNAAKDLLRTTGLSEAERLKAEDDNVRECVKWSGEMGLMG